MDTSKRAWYGWSGNIIKIDLSNRTIKKEPLDTKVAEQFLGGDGLGSFLLFNNLPAGTDPLSPKNPFILSTGPLTGSLCPSSGRLSAVFKSPATGLIGLSNAGGYFAPELKWAGYDALIITGRSDKPVWLWIDNDEVEIRDASHLWGKDTWGTIDTIHHELGDESVSTVTIGPAGEKLVVYALPLTNRGRALGKTGGGAVMGSKNLKAIAVRGSKGMRVHDPDKFEKLCWEFRKSVLSSPHYETWSTYGFPLFYGLLEEVQNALPVYNYQEGTFPEGRESLSLQRMVDQVVAKEAEGCFGCPIQCSHFMHIKEGKYKGVKTEGVEYYAQYIFGPNLGCKDWNFIVKCHEECNRLGVQFTIGAILGWVAELYQRKIVTKEDLDGIEPAWGNEEAFLELIRKVAFREGIGDILAQGWEKAAAHFGKESEKYQTLITRLDTTECPRARWDCAMQAVSNRGGDHNKALGHFTWVDPEDALKMFPDWPKEAVDSYSPIGKAELASYSEDSHAVIDSIGTCMVPSFHLFGSSGAHLDLYADKVTAMTGTDYDERKLLECGARITILERAFNVREGWGRDLYEVSEKWYEQPFPEGVQKGVVLDKKIFNELVDKFLAFKGFDPKTGFPTRSKLEELDLDFVADALESTGRLA
jgi:aldehyde:ferredoxin oxidoreductase